MLINSSSPMIGSVFSNGLELVSVDLSYELVLVDSRYFVENLNGSVNGHEEHSMIESCFLVVSSQSPGGNLN